MAVKCMEVNEEGNIRVVFNGAPGYAKEQNFESCTQKKRQAKGKWLVTSIVTSKSPYTSPLTDLRCGEGKMECVGWTKCVGGMSWEKPGWSCFHLFLSRLFLQNSASHFPSPHVYTEPGWAPAFNVNHQSIMGWLLRVAPKACFWLLTHDALFCTVSLCRSDRLGRGRFLLFSEPPARGIVRKHSGDITKSHSESTETSSKRQQCLRSDTADIHLWGWFLMFFNVNC